MKTNAITLLSMLLACGAAAAQDTVMLFEQTFDSYYLYGEMPDPNKRYTVANLPGADNGGETGFLINIDDSLTIYGIAAAIRKDNGGAAETTLDSSYEYLRLYESDCDTLRAINEAIVFLGKDVDYYVNCDTVEPARNPWYYSEMHECYFARPTTVYDSFYLGTTYHLMKRIDIWTRPIPRYRPILITAIKATYLPTLQRIIGFDHYPDPTNWVRSHLSSSYPLIFPILTPPDTTAGIENHSLCDRLTGVMPNPASETARVVSSLGMSRVEVYDMDGRLTTDLRVPDGSLSTALDVGRWPQGTYLLCIHTPYGVVTKKLAVGR